jgi:proton glutamate symport protein
MAGTCTLSNAHRIRYIGAIMPKGITVAAADTPSRTHDVRTDAREPSHRPKRRVKLPPIGVLSLIAVAVGAGIGLLAPAVGEQLKLFGDLFLNGVKMVVVPLVFPLIVLGIARMESAKKIGRMAGKAILYFEVVTTVILFLAVFLAKGFDLGLGATIRGADPGSVAGLAHGVDFHELILHIVPANLLGAMVDGNLLGVIFFAVLLGIAVSAVGEPAKPLVTVLDAVATAMFRVVGYVIRFAPLGVLGFIAYDVAKYGVGNLGSLFAFVGVVYLGLVLVLGVVFPIIARIYRIPYLTMLRTIADLVGLAFVTRSSEAVLAPLLGRLESLGVGRETSSFVVPLGYSFNTDGSVLYQAIALVFLANAYGTGTSIPHLLVMVAILVIMSKGMAGVASASIVVLIGAAGTIGIPAEGIAILLGVDFLVDMARTAVNVIGNTLAACVIDSSEKRRPARPTAAELQPEDAAAGREPAAVAGTPTPLQPDQQQGHD